MTSSSPPGLARFNGADDAVASAALRAVCASRAWGAAVLARRPYASADDLFAAADAALAALADADLAEAMAGHPPIGRPPPGDLAAAHEQRGMAGAPEALRAEMLALNLAYQERFGHVFLICAAGVAADGLLAAIRERIGNTPERERAVARAELGKINRLRLAKLLADGVLAAVNPAPGAPSRASGTTAGTDEGNEGAAAG
ncbi:2-oxo-4-hydroxy-4-carboxy-5-ureidoimidazoline decarboxylase [Streptomyces sp. AC536]|nr:2-oxo-4-hydroxy-4-carboxy-5-ureidoimidazoline decarboxylase [Streptomyces buecherae]QNJ39464.1 2-oxo-4-hydroxy-4-carboxy-5-ureidoimidazoline decarboxylase [Streptomyces buecherae]